MARSRRLRYSPLLHGIFILLGAFAVGPASASAALPIYNGDLSFPEIHSPSDPEDYSWEVQLEAEQHAEAYYAYEHHLAFGITAEPAHDADGSTVPTSLIVSEGNVITLVVHHRAGNPAKDGAPFVYPIIPGEGWEEGNSHVEIVTGPKDEQELREERERIAREEREATRDGGKEEASAHCLVPRFKGESLKASKRRLRHADCKLGKVKKLRDVTAKTGRVVRQSPKPGLELAPGATVDLTLGE